MAETDVEQSATPQTRPEPTTFTSSQEENEHINAFREWASNAEFRFLDQIRKELIDNLHPINTHTENSRRVFKRELGIVTEWYAFYTFQQELAKRKGVRIHVTKSESENDRKFHFDIEVSILGKLYYVDLTDSKKEADGKANLPYAPGHMNIPAYVDPRHTGVDVVIDIARALWPHLGPTQQREFVPFMQNPSRRS